MSQILLPQRFWAQPQYPAPIDYAGLGKGVQLLFNPAVGPVDLATGRIWTPGGNASVTTGQKGKAFSFDGTDDYYAYTGYPEISGNVGTFFVWCPIVGAADPNGHVFFGHSSPSVCGHQVYPNGALSMGSVDGAGVLSSWFNTTSRSLVFSGGGTAATARVYLDGRDSGARWSVAPGGWAAGSKNFNLGRYVGGTSWDYSGTILIAGYTNAVWGESEARAFHQNPWQLFKAPDRRIFASSGATNYTLTADSFSLTFTGTNADLEYNRALSADSASLSFDVADAILKRGYAISANPVTLDFSVADAVLEYNRVLQSDSVSIDVAVSDASLEYNRALQADPATLSFGVSDATLTYTQPGNYVLAADPVTLGIAAADASLQCHRKLTAEPSELAFNGSDAPLRYARAVIAEAALIAFNVVDAALSRTGGPEPITSIVERTATFRRSKSVTVRFN